MVWDMRNALFRGTPTSYACTFNSIFSCAAIISSWCVWTRFSNQCGGGFGSDFGDGAASPNLKPVTYEVRQLVVDKHRPLFVEFPSRWINNSLPAKGDPPLLPGGVREELRAGMHIGDVDFGGTPVIVGEPPPYLVRAFGLFWDSGLLRTISPFPVGVNAWQYKKIPYDQHWLKRWQQFLRVMHWSKKLCLVTINYWSLIIK